MEEITRTRRLGAALELAGMTVIPVEQIAIHSRNLENNVNASASLDPVGALVISSGDAAFYGINGRRLDPDEVQWLDPELAALIAQRFPEIFTMEKD